MATEHVFPKVPTPSVGPVNMTQACKVCGEPAAGFHFGAFTCEGCKSFFGRTYNNLSSLNECKSSGRCVINKKTRTSCKSCRLRKCLMVGMSKSGSRYGRRSNWFKIHYLMQNNNASSASNEDIPTTHSSTNPTTTTGSATITSWEDSTVGQTLKLPDTSKCFPGHRLASDVDQSVKRQQDLKLAERIRLSAVDLPFNIEVKELASPTPSSSDSISPESPKDSGENLLFPGAYNDPLYPKELMAFYNLPSLGARLPAYLGSPTIAQRILYPYYPNLLSLYSRNQYLGNLLKEANISDISNQPKSHSLSDEDDSTDALNDFQPPTKMIKSNSSPPALFPIQSEGIPSIRPWLNKHSLTNTPSSPPCRSPQSSPKTKEEKSQEKSELTSAQQDLPMDLSVKSKESNDKKEKAASAIETLKFPLGDGLTPPPDSDIINNNAEKVKLVQQNPLDLSSSKT